MSILKGSIKQIEWANRILANRNAAVEAAYQADLSNIASQSANGQAQFAQNLRSAADFARTKVLAKIAAESVAEDVIDTKDHKYELTYTIARNKHFATIKDTPLAAEPVAAIDYSNNSYGDIRHNGVTIHLTQNAYADNTGTDGGVAYFAAGVDDAGNDYRVRWEPTAEWLEAAGDDESDACNWDEYTVRAL